MHLGSYTGDIVWYKISILMQKTLQIAFKFLLQIFQTNLPIYVCIHFKRNYLSNESTFQILVVSNQFSKQGFQKEHIYSEADLGINLLRLNNMFHFCKNYYLSKQSLINISERNHILRKYFAAILRDALGRVHRLYDGERDKKCQWSLFSISQCGNQSSSKRNIQ